MRRTRIGHNGTTGIEVYPRQIRPAIFGVTPETVADVLAIFKEEGDVFLSMVAKYLLLVKEM
jgi:hypothetical protein